MSVFLVLQSTLAALQGIFWMVPYDCSNVLSGNQHADTSQPSMKTQSPVYIKEEHVYSKLTFPDWHLFNVQFEFEIMSLWRDALLFALISL